MYFLLVTFLLVFTAAAPTTQQQPQPYHSAPQYNSGNGGSGGNKQCISQNEAETFIDRYNGFVTQRGSDLGDKFATAQALVAEDFVGPYSSSIRSVQGRPGTNDPVYNSKASFIAGVGNGPLRKISDTLEVIAACDKVIWYFRQATGSARFPAWGFAMFDVVRGGQGWQVKELRVEFDSLAWALNEGAEVEFRDGREIGDEEEGEEKGEEEGKKKGKEGENGEEGKGEGKGGKEGE